MPQDGVEQMGSGPDSARDTSGLLGLWVAGIFAFGFGDTLTSLLVFHRGGTEANIFYNWAIKLLQPWVAGAAELVPLVGYMAGAMGSAVLAFALVKAGAMLAVLVAARVAVRRQTLVAGGMLVLGALLVAHNLAVFAAQG